MLLVESSILHSSRGEEVLSRRGMSFYGRAEAGDEVPLIDTHCHKATRCRVYKAALRGLSLVSEWVQRRREFRMENAASNRW